MAAENSTLRNKFNFKIKLFKVFHCFTVGFFYCKKVFFSKKLNLTHPNLLNNGVYFLMAYGMEFSMLLLKLVLHVNA